jgi:DNA-binding FadR family transcriptional regulator
MDQEAEADPRFALALDGRPLPEVIADKLRDLVNAGELRPGSRLPTESELARRMRVARSSVRTALQRLETLRVLEVRRGLGWYVRRTPVPEFGMSPDMLAGKRYRISDLLEVRIALEGLAASLAALRATDGEIGDIEKFNMQHQDAGGDRDELLRTDMAFHDAIVRASRNELLITTYQSIVGELTEWRYQSYPERGVPLRSAREHKRVVSYLKSGDPGGARAAMNAHLQRLYDGLPEIEDEPLEIT